jgi:hypothetical protein
MINADTIELEQGEIPVEEYYEHLEREGGVVEAFMVGDEVRSPSVQLRMTPFGTAEVLATHEQILGGPQGLTYHGCTMPAGPEYAAEITRHATAVGRLLVGQGVVGRCAIDFLAVRRGERWTTYGSEINLRAGGTTHPMATLSSLTAGDYDAAEGIFRASGGTAKYYQATDHLARPEYAALSTDDLLELLPEHGLGWDSETQTGSVFHMASAIGAMGVVGLPAIADSRAAAAHLYDRSRAALDAAVRKL